VRAARVFISPEAARAPIYLYHQGGFCWPPWPDSADSFQGTQTKIGITGFCGKLVERHPLCSKVPRLSEKSENISVSVKRNGCGYIKMNPRKGGSERARSANFF
jgi:hypothetical protein